MKPTVLLTPGPLTTSAAVKQAMLQDLGTRDDEYRLIIQSLREQLCELGQVHPSQYALIFMQGSGTFGVESVLTSTIRQDEHVLILANGAYGKRMAQICETAHVPFTLKNYPMDKALPLDEVKEQIADPRYTHVAYVHCETTAGVMNDLYRIQECIRSYHKISIVDAMSSFGSVPIAIAGAGIDYLITSANKCLHGVPGVAIIFARKAHLDTCQHCAVSLSLDLYEQYRYMEETQGAFRFTSPTHVMLALQEALTTLITNGGIPARHKRYMHVQKELHDSMMKYGFHTLVEPAVQSCVITTYLCPKGFDFTHFYNFFKAHGFLLYAGKLPGIDAFRIGNIGEISDADILHFKEVLRMYMEENR